MIELFIWVILASVATMSAAYLLALKLNNARVADILWGPGFMLIGLITLNTVGPGGLTRSFLLVWFFTSIWGARLAMHNLLRFEAAREDWRYAVLRRAWGKHFNARAYLRIFLAKAGLMSLVALPLITSTALDGIPGWQLALGSAVWLSGFFYEAIADFQLYRFRLEPKNRQKILTGGLWKFSRHPNYFGEIVQWWGIFILVASLSYIWLSVLSPLVLTALILKINGLPELEARWARSRQYAAYRRAVPAIVPSFIQPAILFITRQIKKIRPSR